MNQATLDLIESFEGFVNHWYPDPGTHGAPYTCCFGHTDAAGLPHYQDNPDRQFSREEGNVILATDLAPIERAVDGMVKVEITANQRGALISFVYNLGAHSLEESTLLRMVNAKNFAGAALQFGRWNMANGRVMPGLTRRRAAEAHLFSTP